MCKNKGADHVYTLVFGMQQSPVDSRRGPFDVSKSLYNQSRILDSSIVHTITHIFYVEVLLKNK